MEFTVTVEHGPLNIEIEGGDRGEIQDEILGLAEFVEENKDTLSEFKMQTGTEEEDSEQPVQTPATEWEDSAPSLDTSDFGSISKRTRVDEETLAQLFEIPDNEDEPPFLSLYQFEEGTEVLGGYRNQRQSQGAVLLLYLWQECRGVEEVELEDLDEGLSFSDIEIERRDAMYQAFSEDARKWFDSDNGEIRLTTPGEHHARQLITDLAEKLESE